MGIESIHQGYGNGAIWQSLGELLDFLWNGAPNGTCLLRQTLNLHAALAATKHDTVQQGVATKTVVTMHTSSIQA